MDRESLIKFYFENKGGINGALIGFVLGVIILFIGFIKTIILAVFVVGGYFVGKGLSEDKDYFRNLFDKFFPPGTYR